MAELPARLAGQDGVEVEVVRDLAVLARHRDAWQHLAAAALEPNVFYEPTALLLALEHFGCGTGWRVVLIRRGQRLIGLVPLQRLAFRGWGADLFLQLFRHSQSFLHTPLFDRDDALPAVRAWLRWCARGSWAGLVMCPRVGVDGPVAALIERELTAAGGRYVEQSRYRRPLLVPGADAESYLERTLKGTRRRELRRQRKRLEEMGALAYAWGEAADPAAWADAFMALEARGWKGEDGGALARRQERETYFRALIVALHARGQANLTSLVLDGRRIAMSCQLRAASGGELFGFKTTYDETLKQLAPGVLLELECIRSVHEPGTGVRWLDSCTIPTKQTVLEPALERQRGDRLPGAGHAGAQRAAGMEGLHAAAALRAGPGGRQREREGLRP